MATKQSTVAATVQPREPTPAEDAAAVIALHKRRARNTKQAAAPPVLPERRPPLTELPDAAFLAPETEGEKLIAIRIRDGEPPAWRAYGLSWAELKATVTNINVTLEAEGLQRLVAAEQRAVAAHNALVGASG